MRDLCPFSPNKRYASPHDAYHIEPTKTTVSISEMDVPCERDNHLKGARFSCPLSEIVDTNAIGRGTMPLIISWYSFLQSLTEWVTCIRGFKLTTCPRSPCPPVSSLPSHPQATPFLRACPQSSGHRTIGGSAKLYFGNCRTY